MSYAKNNWANGDVITAEKMNHMEDGIADAVVSIKSVKINGSALPVGSNDSVEIPISNPSTYGVVKITSSGTDANKQVYITANSAQNVETSYTIPTTYQGLLSTNLIPYAKTNEKGGITLISGTNTVTITGYNGSYTLPKLDNSSLIAANQLPAATTSTQGAMSASDKTKLNGIASGAEVNVQSDWSVTSSSSDAYIKNKPTIPPSLSANNGIKIESNVIKHTNSVTAKSAQALYPIAFDSYGHITSSGSAVTIPTVPSAGTTATDIVATSSSGGSATTWSKSDHVHKINSAIITSALGFNPVSKTCICYANSRVETFSDGKVSVSNSSLGITTGEKPVGIILTPSSAGVIMRYNYDGSDGTHSDIRAYNPDGSGFEGNLRYFCVVFQNTWTAV